MKRQWHSVPRLGSSKGHPFIHLPPANNLDPRSQRPYNTTLPLANSLGIKIDTPCDYKDPKCAAKHAHQYTGGNVLIAWEHIYLPQVAQAIGAKDAPKNPSKSSPFKSGIFPHNYCRLLTQYAGSHFDWIYTVAPPYTKATLSSEDCPGLD